MAGSREALCKRCCRCSTPRLQGHFKGLSRGFKQRRPTSKRKITNLSFFSQNTPKRSSTEVSEIEDTPKGSRQAHLLLFLQAKWPVRARERLKASP